VPDFTNDLPIRQLDCRLIRQHMNDELTCLRIDVHSHSTRRNGYAVSQKHPRPIAFKGRPCDYEYRPHRGARQQDRFGNGDVRLNDKT
jgi:hypothetical protein